MSTTSTSASAAARVVDAVASPCNSVCRIDAGSGWCEGCLRTLDEIAAWSTMDDDAKRAVWEALALREHEPTPGSKP